MINDHLDLFKKRVTLKLKTLYHIANMRYLISKNHA